MHGNTFVNPQFTYHVAAAVASEQGIYVLDPQVNATEPLPLEAWVLHLNAGRGPMSIDITHAWQMNAVRTCGFYTSKEPSLVAASYIKKLHEAASSATPLASSSVD
ncbi:MAG: hypothetical protein EBY22_12450 [Gammaproteobacteria bacterium]|nr:hypothetical protein [Gammaproteobacteria bacterium]